MKRVTKAELNDLVSSINRTLGTELYLEWAYGQPQLYKPDGEGRREVSPRLSKTDMMLWFTGFFRGMWYGQWEARTERGYIDPEGSIEGVCDGKDNV